jgi:xylulokinase
MPVVAGVDSSTQSTTVTLHDAVTGERLATASLPHTVTTPPVSEQNPADWWSALAGALKIAKDAAGVSAADIVGISIAAQCHGLVPLDANGSVIRPAKLWNDTTSAAQSDRLRKAMSIAEWVDRIGSLPPPAFTISKLAWLRDEEPDAFARLSRIALPHDWLTLQLTGEFVTDRSDASGTGYYSASRGEYDFDILGMVDPSKDWASMLPAVHAPQDAAGRVRPEIADELGISAKAIVGAGSGDQHASALGLGAGEGDLVFAFGTSGVVFGQSPVEVHDHSGDVNSVADAAGGYLPLVCTLNAAKVTDTFGRLLGVDHDELARLALAAPLDADRPVLSAFLDGERTPDRPHSRGLLGGISTATSREALALAAYEGVILGLAEGRDSLERAGVAVDGRVIATGGGAASPAYLQLLADTLDTKILTTDESQPVAKGAAIQIAAILQSAPIADVRSAWHPSTTVAATPRYPGGLNIREQYRTLAHWTGFDS